MIVENSWLPVKNKIYYPILKFLFIISHDFKYSFNAKPKYLKIYSVRLILLMTRLLDDLR